MRASARPTRRTPAGGSSGQRQALDGDAAPHLRVVGERDGGVPARAELGERPVPVEDELLLHVASVAGLPMILQRRGPATGVRSLQGGSRDEGEENHEHPSRSPPVGAVVLVVAVSLALAIVPAASAEIRPRAVTPKILSSGFTNPIAYEQKSLQRTTFHFSVDATNVRATLKLKTASGDMTISDVS